MDLPDPKRDQWSRFVRMWALIGFYVRADDPRLPRFPNGVVFRRVADVAEFQPQNVDDRELN